MKLVIIEGVDNTGKDELCNYLKTRGDNLIYRHWSTPLGETIEQQILYQQYSFEKEFALLKSIENDKYFSKPGNMILWNRSHIGEIVYGTMYRDYDPVPWVSNLESEYRLQNLDAYLILLYADSEFVCENDDGLSFSSDIENKNKEQELFNKAYDNSIIRNKIKIKVNEGNEYRHKESIRNEVNKFLGY